MGLRLEREFGLSPDPVLAYALLALEERGREALTALWRQYRDIAAQYNLPFLATTPTRRVNRERAARSGRGEAAIRESAALLRRALADSGVPAFAGGLMGCRGDAYTGEGALGEEEAAAFHAWQADRLAEAGVDFLMAGIMPSAPEAAGMARAMAATGKPYIISFTLRENGCLPDGTLLRDAIRQADDAVCRPPVCYMTNCVHPRTVLRALSRPENRTEIVEERFLGLQANASPKPPEQLDGSGRLFSQSPDRLAAETAPLLKKMRLRILGGCCGTNQHHLEQLAALLAQSIANQEGHA